MLVCCLIKKNGDCIVVSVFRIICSEYQSVCLCCNKYNVDGEVCMNCGKCKLLCRGTNINILIRNHRNIHIHVYHILDCT